MSHQYLSIQRLERTLRDGEIEHLQFQPGVNLLIGRPNTGKTKWIQTLDFLLGDPDRNPFDDSSDTELGNKYESAAAEIAVGGEQIRIERRWREHGAKTKIFVGDEGLDPSQFQQLLMRKLEIPFLNFPKGNPMSGQTWPELSFRMLLRHMYRQQRFWGDIADKQPESEQHACLLQFLGLAERVYSKTYGKLVDLRRESEKLKLRRDHYGQTLDELVRDVLSSESGLNSGANKASVLGAEERLRFEAERLQKRRIEIIEGGRDKAKLDEWHSPVMNLSENRAKALQAHEGAGIRLNAISERLNELARYKADLLDEQDRLDRSKDAGEILSDLKVTHCPACDQTVSLKGAAPDHCFLCHQLVQDEPILGELGLVRLQFERARVAAEISEADVLIETLRKDQAVTSQELIALEDRIRVLERELAPAREAVSALVQEDISAIDRSLGQLSERQRQLVRVSMALEVESNLTNQIEAIEREIEPLSETVDEMVRGTDFGAAADKLEVGINEYLSAINALRPGAWMHNQISVNLSKSGISIRVGSRRWQQALGGTDSLFFLMAYQYGLLSLSNKPGCHYPGFSVIDVPGEFSGEDIEDKENFIVQPFIELLNSDSFQGAQLIMTGASFSGLTEANRIVLSKVHTA